MELYEWMESPIATPGYRLWMKRTPTNHGIVVNLANPWLPKWDETEYSERRWSVARFDGEWHLEIGSISYNENGFDTFDQPAEIFRKYINGEFVVLLTAPLADNVTMNDVTDWDGLAQSLDIK